MRTVTLPGVGLVTSALGFGCAGLYGAPAAAERRRLLETAHSVGIRHFDVAPMYGLGLAERELGRFARSRRDELVIATKFGIAPTAIARTVARVQRPARRLLAALPALHSQARSSAAGPTAGPVGALLYRAARFDGISARASLERSLRELNTDRLDLLLLHDPQPGDVRSDDVCDYLERARGEGHIGAWGLAGEPDPTLRVASQLSVEVPLLQLKDDFLSRSLPKASYRALITFGVLGGSLRRIVAYVSADPDRRRRWGDAVGGDCADPTVTAALLLRRAASRNPDGVVLFSTIRADHLLSAVRAGTPGKASPLNLEAFIGLIDAELPIERRRPLDHE
jgi:D-threo-aldose 1-dehydrogenase